MAISSADGLVPRCASDAYIDPPLVEAAERKTQLKQARTNIIRDYKQRYETLVLASFRKRIMASNLNKVTIRLNEVFKDISIPEYDNKNFRLAFSCKIEETIRPFLESKNYHVTCDRHSDGCINFVISTDRPRCYIQ